MSLIRRIWSALTGFTDALVHFTNTLNEANHTLRRELSLEIEQAPAGLPEPTENGAKRTQRISR